MSTPQTRASLPFDARPLLEPVQRADVRAFAQQLRAQGRVPGLFSNPGAIIFVVVGAFFVIAFGTVFVSIFATVIGTIASSVSLGPGAALAVIVPFLIVVAIAVVVVLLILRAIAGGGTRWYRLDRFARANGMSFVPRLSAPALPGMIFGIGGSRIASDLVRGYRPRFVEFGNYQYTTGSGKDQTTHRWGYVAVKLDVPLPHIVLDAVGNNSVFGSNLPAAFDKHQRLSLEGDFDRRFALYCPEGYEADALYLFTPDIMARFIDNAAALDVEIVDDWLFFYTQREASTLDPATWAWLFSVVAAVLDKLAQWARWRDDRLAASAPVFAAASSATDASAPLPFATPSALLRPPPGVAPAGLRLKRKTPWVVWIVVGAFALFWLLMQTGLLGGFLSFLN